MYTNCASGKSCNRSGTLAVCTGDLSSSLRPPHRSESFLSMRSNAFRHAATATAGAPRKLPKLLYSPSLVMKWSAMYVEATPPLRTFTAISSSYIGEGSSHSSKPLKKRCEKKEV